MAPRFLLPAAVLIGLVAGACEFSLAGDIQPPTGSELGLTTIAPEPLAYPAAAPDPEFGGLIFAQSCAPCHGERGLGDGEQSSALPVEVPAIGDPDLAAASRPDEWYLIVSQGNLDSLMPPFAASLTVQERWDVLAYVFGLSQDDDLLLVGQQLAADLEVEPGDLELVAGMSQAELGEALAGERGLSAEDARALAAYLQAGALGWPASLYAVDTAAEEETTSEGEAPMDSETDTGEAFVLQGSVSNGSGGEIPVGAEILLRGFDLNEESFNTSTLLGEDGSYRFEVDDLDSALVYATTIDYEGLIYFSEAVHLDGTQTGFDLPLVVYETTTDTSTLVVERLQMVFQFGGEGFIHVIQLVSIANSGNRAVVPISDTEPVLFFDLPEEATSLAFESGTIGDRYVINEGGFGDLRAVLPGSGTYRMLYAYELPYGGRLDYSQELFLPVSAASLFVPTGELEVEGSDFFVLGNKEIDGVAFTGYQAADQYPAGDRVSFELIGSHPLGGGNWLMNIVSQSEVQIGFGAFLAVVGIVWYWLHRQGAQGPNPEEIMDAVLALDSRYADGGISDDVYLKRRAALKERLRQALSNKGAKTK